MYMASMCRSIPDDSVACFEADTLKSGREQSDPALVDAPCRGSLAVVPPLMKELGIEFNRQKDGSYSLLRPLGASRPRVRQRRQPCRRRDYECDPCRVRGECKHHRDRQDTRALRLLKADGRVSGALTYNGEDRGLHLLQRRMSLVLASARVLQHLSVLDQHVGHRRRRHCHGVRRRRIALRP